MPSEWQAPLSSVPQGKWLQTSPKTEKLGAGRAQGHAEGRVLGRDRGCSRASLDERGGFLEGAVQPHRDLAAGFHG